MSGFQYSPQRSLSNCVANAGTVSAPSLVQRISDRLHRAAAPVVLTSRADCAEAKLHSIATGVLMAGMKRAGRLKIGKVYF